MLWVYLYLGSIRIAGWNQGFGQYPNPTQIMDGMVASGKEFAGILPWNDLLNLRKISSKSHWIIQKFTQFESSQLC